MATDVHKKTDAAIPSPAPNAGLARKPSDPHPAGRVKHGRLMQIFRGVTFGIYFATCCAAYEPLSHTRYLRDYSLCDIPANRFCSIFITQLLGGWLYWVNRELYYAYMALTKQSFALTTTAMTHLWGPARIRISGDVSVAGQIRKTPAGTVQFDFPERLILIANHQIYTDWLYLWWVAYANEPGMHGHFYIILKESLKYIPLVGWGMMFYGFIFMSRKMATDRPRLAHRLNKLKEHQHVGPDGKKTLDPMWLLLFPEGTNLAANGRRKSAAWAEKTGLKDPEHVLLPRSTGMFFCLSELKGTLEYVYDCTVAYEGIPRGKFGEQYFSLVSTYFQGRPPKSVNFHWRRYRVADMPLHDQKEFDAWVRERWYEKDALMEEYVSTGRFPPSKDLEGGYIETEVRLRSLWELSQVYVVVGAVGLVFRMLVKTMQRWTGS
ncbi:lysocardiolipin acyltransferase [Colletotrichum plurivorum]|uniref:Lysocardiolipin acyltransferase n=1 Tax=Colletotrichum plurivorum TaxID=2175906 RepID=A0A8H6K560_9PEZI|nr:lysocardiolipin acyltransferase [Colletotrichum plurivorum]